MNGFRKVLDTEYYTYYTVESGDSLYSISRKFNVNPNAYFATYDHQN